ncbi:gibberellin 2-beta-dioxygenase 2-like [Gossypium arboreum]|uniref:Fe2OG dioxygenase domain-containing protein n=1 Tax=Gossypium arboreum TaxID=29729 RepID=A0ABR0NPV8_GOSAR|nr:gibberellin 2-beta-dioxygenase 2-like [Gossypium arboreum]KAK5803356.1 hypothetical protein PVK06_031001 [Gossypium arboreum]
MVVLSKPAPLDDHYTSIKTCKPRISVFKRIPSINLRDPKAKTLIIQACQEFGFFKLLNHGVPMETIARLEAEALSFFNLPRSVKDKAGPPNPFGYGTKGIGPNGDVGWIEYLLINTDQNPEISRSAVKDYVMEVKAVAYEVVELIAEGLGIEQRDVWSKMLREEESDWCLRLNHYPISQDLQALSGRKMIGFGEHTDPQIISLLKSNNTSGLQVCLKDGTWVSVPPDHTSFFVTVGDALQVMTNGRLKSVRHRVMTNSLKPRISMIYFGGPPLSETIRPLPSLMAKGEESLYNEFTWREYKASAYKSRLGDYRLGLFEKASTTGH